MRRNTVENVAAIAGVSTIPLIFLGLMVAIGAFCWPYSIATLTGLFTAKVVNITWWQGALLGFVPYLNRLTVPLAVVAWILSLIL